MKRRVGIVIALAARPYRRAEKSLGIAGIASADVLMFSRGSRHGSIG